MGSVLVAAAIVPSTPLLVPELAGAAAAETADLRTAVLTAAAVLPGTWIAIGVGDRDQVCEPGSTGTFAGYGVDVEVVLSPQAHQPADLPLGALIAGWIRGRTRPDAQVRAYLHAATLAGPAAVDRGRQLRGAIDATDEPTGVLVVADGCHTLTAAAPGGHDPDSVEVQTALDDALAGGNTAALEELPDAVVGRVAWAVAAGLFQPGPRVVTELYRGAPFGVGYFAGVWQP
ncbi:MAG: hypothetical protein K0R68_300 [Mycobacterium sp.]|nr:hypothetical protein [Mycobacterium sp.]